MPDSNNIEIGKTYRYRYANPDSITPDEGGWENSPVLVIKPVALRAPWFGAYYVQNLISNQVGIAFASQLTEFIE